MSLDMSPSMFSQPSGIHQPIAGSVMNAIMGHMTQQGGIGNLFSGGNNYTDDDRIRGNTVASFKSNGRRKTITARSSTITIWSTECRYTRSTTGYTYTQQALEMMNEHANNNPQGFHSHYLVILWEEEQNNNCNNII
jgi:hypothetical protein